MGSCQVKNNNNNNKTSFHRKLPGENLICFHRKLPGKNLICFHRKLPGKNLICFHRKLPWGGDSLLHPYKQTSFSPFSRFLSEHWQSFFFQIFFFFFSIHVSVSEARQLLWSPHTWCLPVRQVVATVGG